MPYCLVVTLPPCVAFAHVMLSVPKEGWEDRIVVSIRKTWKKIREELISRIMLP